MRVWQEKEEKNLKKNKFYIIIYIESKEIKKVGSYEVHI